MNFKISSHVKLHANNVFWCKIQYCQKCYPNKSGNYNKNPWHATNGRQGDMSILSNNYTRAMDNFNNTVFLSCKANARRSLYSPGIISLPPLSLATDVTDVTFGASGLWLGTRTGAGGTDILA